MVIVNSNIFQGNYEPYQNILICSFLSSFQVLLLSKSLVCIHKQQESQ